MHSMTKLERELENPLVYKHTSHGNRKNDVSNCSSSHILIKPGITSWARSVMTLLRLITAPIST